MQVGDLVKVKISEEDPEDGPPVVGVIIELFESGAGHPRADVLINGWAEPGWFLQSDLEVIAHAGR